ncbi:HTH domain-containing protein [Clostridium sp.]|uniref:HTH domain-containing protein n=1 Tax=Clostridium sp. TaxID=1506 RepID=UPI001D9E84ED|nr:HTH domain-containing protein [Clostridium sp.]MBS5987092.1 HTH domain-containing protein [Clostridium sp.]
MKATQRQKKLIEFLTYHVDYVTVKNLSDELSVSKRKIHNDLLQIEEEGSSFEKTKFGIKIIKY